MGSGTYKAYMSFSVLSIIPLLLSFPLEYIYPFLLDFPTNLLYMESHQVVCWLWNQKTQAQFKLLLCDSLLVSSLGTTGPVFIFVVIVQLLSNIWLFATPWAAAHQASLSFTTSQSSLTLMSLSQWCHPTTSSSATHFSFPSIRVFPGESTPRLRRERRTCMKHLDILQIPSGFKPSLPKLTSSTFLCSRPTRNIAKPGSSCKSAIVAATRSVSECP